MSERSTKPARTGKALAAVTLVAMLLALPAAAVFGGDGEKTEMRKTVDGYAVGLAFTTTPRSSSDNAVIAKLSAVGGRPVSGATVTVAATSQTAKMSHHGGGTEDDSRGGGHEMSGHDSGGAMDMGGADEHTMPSDDHSMPSGEHTMPSDDHSMPSDEHTMPSDEHTMPSDDHAMPGDDHTMPSDDHTMPGDDHSMPSGDHAMSGPEENEAAVKKGQSAIVLRPSQIPGAYEGSLEMGEGDASQVSVKFTVAGKTRAATFTVNTERRRPRALAFGGFAVANILVLLAAAIVGRRSTGARHSAEHRTAK